jgi:hypothetical protein
LPGDEGGDDKNAEDKGVVINHSVVSLGIEVSSLTFGMDATLFT